MNHIGGWDTEATEYSFTGMPLKRIQHHSDTDSSFAETSTYSYDNMDRPLTIAHQLDDDEPVTVSDLSYDLLGRVASEKRNGNPELATAFSYNIRSWLKASEGDILSMRFYHEDTREGALSNTRRFDGGISALDWSVRGGHAGGYNFSYDGFTRLTEAEYVSADPDGENFSTAYSYDANGNILSLTRYGAEENPSRPVEALSMEYDGNRLATVSDSGTARDRALRRKTARLSASQEDFTYDANGNLTSDLTAGIAAVSYNLLNLPQSFSIVTEDGSAETRYLYDADGRKLRVTATDSDGTTSVTDYSANVVRTDGKVDRILFEGGYIHNGKYHFFFSDHLGSVRAVACEDGSVIQSSAYYPFGKTFGDSPDTCSSSQPYKFNGKEDQSFASVPLLDYGTRLLSTRTGRWTTMDPLAEKYYSISPYAYCGNNPVNLIDPDGTIIIPKGAEELDMIRNTLPEEDREYVKLDENGQIDAKSLNEHKSKSGNYNLLSELVNSDKIVEVVLDDKFTFMKQDGKSETQTMTYVSFDPKYDLESDKDINGETINGLSTGESGFMGQTLFPDKDCIQNSPNGNIIVIINKNLSPAGAAETYSHEANGHALLYIKNGGNHNGASHQSINKQWIEGNEILKRMIISSKKETIVNMQKR